MLKVLVFSVCLFIVNGAPSLPTYKEIHATATLAPQNAYEQPQEDYSQQYAPAVIPENRIKDSASRSANTDQTEIALSMNNNSKVKQDAAAINPAPSTQFLLLPKDSVIPKLSGYYIKNDNEREENSGPITNPAAYYLAGADIEKLAPTKCQMTGCDGPVPNDYDIYLESLNKDSKNEACHHTFVPLNGCLNNRGYPLGMICTICCDCTVDFVNEIKKSRGYIQGYVAK